MEEPVYVLNDGYGTVIPLVKEIGRGDVGGDQGRTRWLRIKWRLKRKREKRGGDLCLAFRKIGEQRERERERDSELACLGVNKKRRVTRRLLRVIRGCCETWHFR